MPCVLPGAACARACCHCGGPSALHVTEPRARRRVAAEGRRKRDPAPLVCRTLWPGGSRSLGSELHSLASGSAAPLVGVVMRVSRAVRLRDGKMLVLATGLGRFKVRRAQCAWLQLHTCLGAAGGSTAAAADCCWGAA